MASEQDDTVFPEEDHDLDDDEESEDDDDVLVDEEEDYDEEDLNSASTIPTTITTNATTTTTTTMIPNPAITVAFPSASAVTVALPATATETPDPKRQRIMNEGIIVEEKKPLPIQLDDTRRLFQRLWTDEDEIELLQGFLDYTTQRGNAHHHDTALFYDQIKSKLQLDFNKNQLVEKLRRLKKKYRNVISKISSGKDFNFKTAHDQATFEISRKIWSNGNITNVNVLEDDDGGNQNQNHNINNNNNHQLILSSNEVKTSINNNNNVINSHYISNNHNVNEEKMTPSRSRKRSRAKPVGVVHENVVLMNHSDNVNVNSGGGGGGGGGPSVLLVGGGVGVGSGSSGGGNNNGIAAVVEETVRSCLSPLFKELLSNAMGGGGGGGVGGGRGIGGLAMNAVMPLGFGGATMGFGGVGGGRGEMADEKWRKQQILELEVYSKRLELVQDQIKVTLEELRSMGGGVG